ncbi:phospholipase D family protein, partial [Nocardioides lentus]
MTRLVLQNPGNEPSLLTTLLGALDDGLSGGGVFAWTNRTGIAAVLESDAFTTYIKKHPFQLVVGTDSITNETALDRLLELTAAHPRLDLRMFVHDKNVIFHPKMVWVQTPAGLRLLVGSGNLTRSGLQASWEIFTDSLLTGVAATEAKQALEEWREENAAFLLAPTNPQVREAVAQNVPSERSLRQRSKKKAKPVV